MRCILEPGQNHLFSPILFQEFSDVVRNPPFRIETPTFKEDFGTIQTVVSRSRLRGFSVYDVKNVVKVFQSEGNKYWPLVELDYLQLFIEMISPQMILVAVILINFYFCNIN